MKHALGFLLACLTWLTSCGGNPAATQNRTFYDWSVATGPSGRGDFEQPYAPLDQAGVPPLPDYVGVSVIRGGVRLSRPKNWMLRDGGNQPKQAFVQYISPSAYSFAVYERVESPSEEWKVLQQRFEDDTLSVGAKVSGGRVPMATFEGQGRAFTVDRQVEAAKRPLSSRSREYLIRGEHRVVLVQIVHEGDTLSAVDAELTRVVRTLQVL